jgi:hypothetical protein
MMRSKLLLAAATIALAVGTSAVAQQPENRGGPVEKSAPSTTSKPDSGKPDSGTVHQNRSEPSGRSGQSGSQSGSQSGRSQTTGQAPQERSGAQERSNAGRQEGRERADSANKASEPQDKGSRSEPNRANRGDREHPAVGQNERSNRNDRDRATTGQATPGERRNDDVQINRDRNNVDRDRTTIDRDRTRGDRDESRTTINENGSSSGRSVDLTEQQRTRIHEVIVKERGAPRANNVNFSLTVGTPVPRTVKLVRVPSTIVEIEPAWRDFEYFLVGDEIVIVNPRKMEIVAIVPA